MKSCYWLLLLLSLQFLSYPTMATLEEAHQGLLVDDFFRGC